MQTRTLKQIISRVNTCYISSCVIIFMTILVVLNFYYWALSEKNELRSKNSTEEVNYVESKNLIDKKLHRKLIYSFLCKTNLKQKTYYLKSKGENYGWIQK